MEPSPDLARVAALPRREPASDAFIDALSQCLRKRPDARLREPQAAALRELFDLRGLFAPMRVGSGKTLVTLLAPTVLQSQRPVLVVPASRIEDTRAEFAEYWQSWHVRLPTLVSYQELGHPRHEDRLANLRPDLLMLDEAHFVRNWDAAVTRRVRRCIGELQPVTLALSGTLITDELMDYWHLICWTLNWAAPVPLEQAEAERWAEVVDRNVIRLHRVDAGAQSQVASLPGGFHSWLRGSRGVVPTPGSDCDAALKISTWAPAMPPKLKAIIDDVALTSMRPDGELLDEWELPECLCQLACGFYYVWDPMPPDWWLLPRRAWRAYERSVLDEHLPGFDSPSMIANALDHGGPLQPPAANLGRELLQAWRAVRDQFTPNPVPVWLDASIMTQAVERAGAGCLIWTKYRAVGHLLEGLGVPYYGGGTNPRAAKGKTIAASIAAHGTGKNLQAWHRSLVLTPMANANAWEQLIGRTHRLGQRADTVHVDVLASIDYHGAVLGRVLAEARATSAASGFSHKLVDADWTNKE